MLRGAAAATKRDPFPFMRPPRHDSFMRRLGVTYEPSKLGHVAFEACRVAGSTQNWHPSAVKHELVALARLAFEIGGETRRQWLHELSIEVLRQEGHLTTLELTRQM